MIDETKRILLVEDNPKDTELVLAALHEINLASEVVVVNDGEQALDFLYRRGNFGMRAEGNPAVILLDYKLPKIDGLEVLRTIKRDDNLRAIPVVMLTSSREEQDLINSYHNGVNAYVVKAVDFAQLTESVRELGVFWALVNEPPPGSAGRKPSGMTRR